MASDPDMMSGSRVHAGSIVLLAALALALALALAATAAGPASATTPPAPQPAAFALSPLTPANALRFRGSSGRVLHGAVLISDISARPITVILQAADIHNSSNGNANYITNPVSQVGSWIMLASTRVRLAARSSRRVTFTVTVPAGSIGGSHYGGIVAINAADLATPAVRKTTKTRTISIFRVNRQALPITIRLPGTLTRSLALVSAKLAVSPVGAAVVLGLLPAGNVLIEAAPIRLRVSRGAQTIFTYAAPIGQLFPGSPVTYRIAWKGRPTPGSYHVVGVIRPQGAAVVKIDETVGFTAKSLAQLETYTPGVPQPTSSIPWWVWLALIAALALLIALSLAVWRLSRRPVKPAF
jgi:hypothetical protein